ncbi:hypothetical protein SAMN05660662_2920 [Blastococcus aurantiacus]|uniref:Methyltransferase domain-containing protein n=1 Tax=Blastococcus aurantiacus TaxID=1550231 RepID=A0A1G7MVR3_9ACTN|nr:hypothetical protein [Blastococcus aurantiacus]SDF65150.1 hypothetical protein SAMN05660662_2920 [Blastococcus aurantiacus]
MSARPLWLRVYLTGERRIERLVQDLHGVWDGVWLGTLTPEQLGVLDRAYYDGEGMYRTETYNRRGLFEWERRIVDSHFLNGGRIAVLGAGGGREVLALLATGYDVQGFEPNAELVAVGAQLTMADGHGSRVSFSPRDGWSAPAESFDGVLVGWGAYMLIPYREARVALLRQASVATRGDGVVAVSFFTMQGDRRPFHIAYRVARLVRRLLGRPAPLMGDALVPNFAHHFTRSQVVEELTAAGLELVEWGTTPGGYGWVVARRAVANKGASGE